MMELIWMARSTPEVRAVHSVCYNNMMSGDIQVESLNEASKRHQTRMTNAKRQPLQNKTKGVVSRPDKSEAIQEENMDEEVERQQRSIMWGRFMEEVSIIDVALGFVIVSHQPNTEYLAIKDTDPLQPCVLEMSRLVIRHRVNVYSKHEWQVFEKMSGAAAGDSKSLTNFNLRPIKNIKVIGRDLPDARGVINSRMTRLLSGPYQLYISKLHNTFIADQERSRPTTFMHIEESNDNADDKALAADPTFSARNGIPPPNREQRRDILRNMREVEDQRCGTAPSDCPPSGPPGGPAGGGPTGTDALGGVMDTSNGMSKYQLPRGRELANNHMAEAPADLLPARLAFFEAVCLQFGMPMSMLSVGDSSGKAKLNSSHAGAETARIFVEAQATRKREAKLMIEDIHEFMYGETVSQKFFKETFEATGKRPKFEDTERARRVAVTMPANPDVDTILLLHSQGILRWPHVARALASRTGFPFQAFNTTPQLILEDLAFGEVQEPPPAAASSAASSTKRKLATKSKSSSSSSKKAKSS
jgi:hypothetical protein